MHSFNELLDQFSDFFSTQKFPGQPAALYDPCEYFLGIGGKRIRPVCCLMGNELFGELHPDVWNVAMAIELFHNFTLIHDDIMDRSDLRRGKVTVHKKYGEETAVLSGDVMLIIAYTYLNKIDSSLLHQTMTLFNKTATEVCEGQQFDMDFEKRTDVQLSEYIEMITLKTSVLLAASLSMGAFLAGASIENCDKIYEFGKNLGIGFQVQDDFLDVYGNPDKFGKVVGGDIRRNKKTFLMLYALEHANEQQKNKLNELFSTDSDAKVAQVMDIFEEVGVKQWAIDLKQQYSDKALQALDGIDVEESRKQPLKDLTFQLLSRDV
ncbi:MAG: polyprenyl synthetase [Pseudopedobacter saltans]|uniref:Polyprenyl synthetase n=1 Tax=Pseudopedobacter saltans TaxID=151895 RepID=A0A2W5EJD8_9SPHI|nr:MAG: polyprenyl synthetase [Pseudopedobacter saltans]